MQNALESFLKAELRIIGPKYIKAAQSIDQAPGFAIDALPPSGFGKCMAGASLIAQILIDRGGGLQILGSPAMCRPEIT